LKKKNLIIYCRKTVILKKMGVELILGMEEVINYLKELEAENKKLKEQNECVQRQIESVCKVNDELKEENKILKEEIEWKNITIRKEVNRNKKLEEELLASNTALEIVKDENEVNKDNMKKFMSENKKLNKMIKYLPNDMEDKWWCEKNEKWRWEGDGYLSEIDDDYEEPDSP